MDNVNKRGHVTIIISTQIIYVSLCPTCEIDRIYSRCYIAHYINIRRHIVLIVLNEMYINVYINDMLSNTF